MGLTRGEMMSRYIDKIIQKLKEKGFEYQFSQHDWIATCWLVTKRDTWVCRNLLQLAVREEKIKKINDRVYQIC